MVAKSPTESDEQAIMALQRFSTRADVHGTNGLTYTYRLHCAVGNIGAGEADNVSPCSRADAAA